MFVPVTGYMQTCETDANAFGVSSVVYSNSFVKNYSKILLIMKFCVKYCVQNWKAQNLNIKLFICYMNYITSVNIIIRYVPLILRCDLFRSILFTEHGCRASLYDI